MAEGKVLTSGKTVHGQGTKFLSTIEKEDFLLVDHSKSQQREERVVLAIMSDKSLLISEPFSNDIINFEVFLVRKHDRIEKLEDTLEEQYEKKYL